jgi:hypothetical protein
MLRLGFGVGVSAGRGRRAPAVDRGVPIAPSTNCSVAPEGDGWLITKTAGGSAYNAQAVSAQAVGDFLLRIRFAAGGFALGGMSGDPGAGSDLASIRWGLEYYRAGNSLYVYRDGASVPGAVAPFDGSYGWIRRSGGRVKWRFGATFEGGAEILDESADGAPAWFDASIYSQGAQIAVRLIAL